jgi:lysophospholipase L1-like esterase
MNRSQFTRCFLVFPLGLALLAAPGYGQNTPLPAPDLPRNPPARPAAVNPKLPSIFVAGDSTAAVGKGETQQGWAVPLADYFDVTKVNIVNAARGGRSSRTFVTEGLWDAMLAQVKAGDLVLIQFGINDSGAVNDASRARGSIPGVGEETQEIDNLVTKKHEVVHSYGWYLRKMIADTQARGARPFLLGLTIRDIWTNGKVERAYGRYNQWAAEVAKTAGVPFLDVTGVVADKFEAMGEEKTKAIYIQDHTHFNLAGADMHAAAVVSLLKGLKADPSRQFLSAKGAAVAAAPKQPN